MPPCFPTRIWASIGAQELQRCPRQPLSFATLPTRSMVHDGQQLCKCNAATFSYHANYVHRYSSVQLLDIARSTLSFAQSPKTSYRPSQLTSPPHTQQPCSNILHYTRWQRKTLYKAWDGWHTTRVDTACGSRMSGLACRPLSPW